MPAAADLSSIGESEEDFLWGMSSGRLHVPEFAKAVEVYLAPAKPWYINSCPPQSMRGCGFEANRVTGGKTHGQRLCQASAEAT